MSAATARALVPGDPEQVRELARSWQRAAAMTAALGGRLSTLPPGDWSGDASDGLRLLAEDLAEACRTAADALGDAVAPCSDYARVLEQAQRTAARVVALRQEAAHGTAAWQQAQERSEHLVRRAEAGDAAAVRQLAQSPAVPSSDPGAEARQRADALLAGAHEDVQQAGDRAARALGAAADVTPPPRDLAETVLHLYGEYYAGLGESVREMAETGIRFSPQRMALDPRGWADDVLDQGRGVVDGVLRPRELLDSVLDLETWRTSPARAAGRLVPDLLLSVIGGGGVAGRIARSRRRPRGAPPTAPRTPDELREILASLPKGSSPRVRTAKDAEELRRIFSDMVRGTLPDPRDPGRHVLPDGTVVRIRSTSQSGGTTVDINIPGGGKPRKIHTEDRS